jgi:hypothetical protein
LTKEVKGLYNENYKMLKTAIEELEAGTIVHVHGAAELIL